MGSPITLYEWIQDQFAPGSPQANAAIDLIGPHLAGVVHEGDMVLDLCCGAGTWSFFLEDMGASVVGVDFAEYMIDRAQVSNSYWTKSCSAGTAMGCSTWRCCWGTLFQTCPQATYDG